MMPIRKSEAAIAAMIARSWELAIGGRLDLWSALSARQIGTPTQANQDVRLRCAGDRIARECPPTAPKP
jgi:hypothetical protein